MTGDFKAGVDWFVSITRVFTLHEARLLWALRRSEGQMVSHDDMFRAMTGRQFAGSNTVNTHLHRIRPRALAMGMDIECVRNRGWRMVMVEKEAA